MKKLVTATALLSALSAPVFAKSAEKTSTKHPAKPDAAGHGANIAPEISLTELKTLVDENEKTPTAKKVYLIDANGDKSYKNGHIPGAIHYDEKNLDAFKKSLPADKSALVVAYCGGPLCTAWEAAAKQAKADGYTNVKHLKAGIKGWTDAKYPTSKI